MITAEQESSLGPETLPHEPEIETLLMHLNEAEEESLCARTLRELVLSYVLPVSISINRPAVR